MIISLDLARQLVTDIRVYPSLHGAPTFSSINCRPYVAVCFDSSLLLKSSRHTSCYNDCRWNTTWQTLNTPKLASSPSTYISHCRELQMSLAARARSMGCSTHAHRFPSFPGALAPPADLLSRSINRLMQVQHTP